MPFIHQPRLVFSFWLGAVNVRTARRGAGGIGWAAPTPLVPLQGGEPESAGFACAMRWRQRWFVRPPPPPAPLLRGGEPESGLRLRSSLATALVCPAPTPPGPPFARGGKCALMPFIHQPRLVFSFWLRRSQRSHGSAGSGRDWLGDPQPPGRHFARGGKCAWMPFIHRPRLVFPFGFGAVNVRAARRGAGGTRSISPASIG